MAPEVLLGWKATGSGQFLNHVVQNGANGYRGEGKGEEIVKEKEGKELSKESRKSWGKRRRAASRRDRMRVDEKRSEVLLGEAGRAVLEPRGSKWSEWVQGKR
jgi:hypothetical protein